MFDFRFRRFIGGTSFGIVMAGGIGAAVLTALHPAAAAGVLAQIDSLVTCSTTGACVAGTNTSSGQGVAGTSKSGVAVLGTSTSKYGVQGISSSNLGVKGSTTSGMGGVVGYATTNDGVYGYNGTNATGSGVLGFSPNSVGVFGTSTNGTGLEADSTNGTGLYVTAESGTGILVNNSGATSVITRNSNGNAGDFEGTYLGLIGRAPASGGFPLVLTDQNSNDVFYVDGVGNVSYHGSLNTFARTSGGATATAFSSKSTAPTLEDTGTAQLVGGVATVRLDPTFASSVETAASYRVFVTPDGDTHGLFVATKTPVGFIVREAQGGRSTVNFDYRVVATGLGDIGRRMAITATLRSQPRAARPSLPASMVRQHPATLAP